jgi:hypothetical protein
MWTSLGWQAHQLSGKGKCESKWTSLVDMPHYHQYPSLYSNACASERCVCG